MQFRKNLFLPLLAAVLLLAAAPVWSAPTVEIYDAYSGSQWGAPKDKFRLGDKVQYCIHFGVSGLELGETYRIKWITTVTFAQGCEQSWIKIREEKLQPGYNVMRMNRRIPWCAPTFTWEPEVTYTVKLVEVGPPPVVEDTDEATSNLYLYPPLDCVQPTAAFSWEVDDEDDLQVNCTDESTGDINEPKKKWKWNFGDGSPGEVYLVSSNPSHTYAAPGTYKVRLTVIGDCGRDVMKRWVTVQEEEIGPPLAMFSVDKNYEPAPLTVTFTDESSGDIDDWDWDFGDEGTSTAQNPVHVFSDSGWYKVTLTVSNDEGQEDTYFTYIVAE